MTDDQVRISLVMTVLNESGNLPGYLESLGRQSRRPDEIVIVDGGSTDGTLELLNAWTPPDGVDVVVLSVPGASISEGRNVAIAAAAGPWIAANDAGTHLGAGWFETMATRMTDDVDVVSGFSEPLEGAFLASTIAAVITPTLDEIDPARFLPSSRSVAFRKTSWADVGGYPEWLDYCEDLVFDFALLERGHRVVFEPAAIVGWDARPTYRAFFKQYYRYARGDGKADLWRKRHIARYGAYVIGLALIVLAIVLANPIPLVLLAVGGIGYLAKFWRRVWRRRGRVIKHPLASLLLVPLTVVIGDVAKMVGYPVGIAWRRRHGHVH